jgi:Pvc16 N-terminal domain
VASSDVISALSATLESRLTAGLKILGGLNPPVAQLHDLVTPVTEDPPTVTLFLYQILEDPTVRNRAGTQRIVNGEVLRRKQPLGLRLQYMITAWGGDRHTEQRMLGRVLQILYDDAILDGLDLAGVLAGSDARVDISLSPIELEDRARVWSAIGQTYRLSINYEVRVVDIDAEAEIGATPVRERRLETEISA